MEIMKVTILSNSKGGLFTATMQWAKGLARKGCDVNILFLTQSEEAKRLAPSEHIRIDYLTFSNHIPNLRALVNFLIHYHTDIIHINFASFGPLAILKKYVFKTPFIYTLHGLPQPWLERSLKYKVAYTVEACLLPIVASRSSAVVAVSNYVKDMLKRKYGIDSEVIYHGINAEDFEPKKKERSKRKLGYNETDLVILFVGKLHPYKDPLTLIKAIPGVIKKNANLHLVIIGDGELYPEVEKEISGLNLSNYVKLFRHLTDEKLRIFYDAADLFVLTSASEAFGMTLLEAMASGLPVVASNFGACPEVIGNAGLLFNQGDHTSLAREIITLVSNDQLSKILRTRSIKRVRKFFSWDDKVDKYWKLYKRATKQL